MRTAIALLLLAVLGLAAVAGVTEGFRVVTTEAARRLMVTARPAVVADARLVDQAAAVRPLHAILAADGRIAIVDFIYTRCDSICAVLGNEFQQLQREILARGLQDRVRLISISFDPAHDRPPALARYAARMGADAAVWQFAGASDERELAPVLGSFGVVVVADGAGGFVHNAALHVVTPAGRLVRIRDLGEFRQALDEAATLAGGGAT